LQQRQEKRLSVVSFLLSISPRFKSFNNHLNQAFSIQPLTFKAMIGACFLSQTVTFQVLQLYEA